MDADTRKKKIIRFLVVNLIEGGHIDQEADGLYLTKIFCELGR
jgi:hypothetical protein